MIRRADAIVIGTPTLSYGQLNNEGGIETVTKIVVDEVVKGPAPNDTLDVFEPGGEVGNLASYIAGSPRFEQGRRVLLFLTRTGPERWSVTDLVLGKFSFTSDASGRRLLARDAEEIVGWDPDLRVHRERARDEQAFLQFIRAEVASRKASEDYFVESPASRPRTGRSFSAVTNAAFTATSYTMFISGSQGARWNVFPNGVTFFTGTTTEPGAPGGGSTAVQTSINSWNGDPNSNVNYVYGGTDNGSHTQGLHAADNANTVLFERDLSSWGVSPFTCTSNSYSGTLGLGGVTSASGTHSLNGETFVTTKEGDVEMNRGLANCTLLFNNGDFNSAVAHEMGHTLGFRHSDQTRDSNGPCSNDPSLECSNQAIMKSFVSGGLNAALQAWDQHAVAAVYPNTTTPPPTCTAPAITAQPQSRTITRGQAVNIAVTATGTAPLTYQWYQGASGNTSTPVATSQSINVAPTSTTSYWVRVSNACGAVNSATATITVNPPASTSAIRGDFNGDGIADLIWRNFSTGDNRLWFLSSTGQLIASAAFPAVADLNWHIVGAGDFNGDGKQDIVWRNFATGADTVWLMNGATFLSSLTLPSVTDLAWRIESVNDFNRDGKPDLLWRHYSSGFNVIWYMNGGTLLSSTNAGSQLADLTWHIQGSGDFNGDGVPDFLWRNSSSGRVDVWFMTGSNGATFSSSKNLYTIFDPNIELNAVARYNADTTDDIAQRNYTNGVNQAWIMSGGSIVNTYVFPSDTNLSWHIVGPR